MKNGPGSGCWPGPRYRHAQGGSRVSLGSLGRSDRRGRKSSGGVSDEIGAQLGNWDAGQFRHLEYAFCRNTIIGPLPDCAGGYAKRPREV